MNKRLAVASLPIVLGLVVVPLQATAQEVDPIVGPTVIEPVFVGETVPLTELADAFAAGSVSLASLDAGETLNPDVDLRALKASTPLARKDTTTLLRAPGDPARQHHDPFHGTTPEPTLSFEGTTDWDNALAAGVLLVPPDTEGDVGHKFYAQMNNIVFEIFDKRDGASVIGPLPNNLFWAGTGAYCEAWNDGDPVVLYDHQARRWIFSQFATFEYLADVGQYVSHQCFAVSKTSNPLGAYYLYDYVTATPEFRDGAFAALNDYPKLGIWTDGIYYSANDFEYAPTGQFANVSAIAFNKWAMYRGKPAIGIQFKIGPLFATDEIYNSLLPSHWEGDIRPRWGAPNTFWQMWDSEEFTFSGATGPDGVLHWDFYANFRKPMKSKFVPRGLIEMPEYESYVCSGDERNCVDQPEPGDIASGNGLDTIDFRLMFRSQYRNFGKYASTVISATVDADGDATNGEALAGIRWAELRSGCSSDDDCGRCGGHKKGGHGEQGWHLHQSGTFAPDDGEQRFMPSIAQNKKGEIALGYTVSSLATYPAVRYTMRQKYDSLGEMGGGEVSCFEGSGSQIDSYNRWGDYSAMSVDPSNDCTFWYTNEYYDTTESFDFKTRICKFNRCGSGGHHGGGHGKH